MTTWSEAYSPTIQTGATFEEFQANYVPASEVLNELAEQSGYWWKIDFEGNLHFNEKEFNEVAYTLTASDVIGKPSIEEGNLMYRNVQYIKGTRNTTPEQVEVETGDGEKRNFTTGYQIKEEPKIE